jgi:preprotein translocase subunit SecG
MNGKIIRRITAWIMALLIVFSACMAVASSAPETREKNWTKIIFVLYCK